MAAIRLGIARRAEVVLSMVPAARVPMLGVPPLEKLLADEVTGGWVGVWVGVLVASAGLGVGVLWAADSH